MVVLIIIFKVLVSLLLAILGILLCLLIIPFSYSGQVLAADGFKIQLAVGWAWKLLGINAEIEGAAVDVTLRVLDKRIYRIKNRESAKEDKAEEKAPGEKEIGKRTGKGFGIKDITDRALINEITGYLKRVLNIVRPKYLHLYCTYGFDDPSLTGMVCGAAGIIKSMVPNARLHLNPDFTRDVLDLDLRAEGSMIAGSLVYETIRTVLKKPVRKILFRKKKLETFFI